MANEFIDELDFHKKAIYADEIGVGACICLAGDIYNVKFIADADYFIERTISDQQSPYYNNSLQSLGIYGKTGKAKPDYFCLTRDRKAVVIEAKGTFGPRSNLTAPIKKGKEQVRNVIPEGVTLRDIGSGLVIATQIPIQKINQRSLPNTIVADPDFDKTIAVRINEEEIIRHSLAKAFRFAGFSSIAERFINRRDILPWLKTIQENVVSADDQRFVVGRTLNNGWTLSFNERLIKILISSEENKKPIVELVAEYEWGYEKQSIDTPSVKLLPMGFGLVHAPRRNDRLFLGVF